MLLEPLGQPWFIQLAGREFFQFGDEQQVMGGRLITVSFKRCLRPGAERTAVVALGVLRFDGVRMGFEWAR